MGSRHEAVRKLNDVVKVLTTFASTDHINSLAALNPGAR
jgi:hypothetical protein